MSKKTSSTDLQAIVNNQATTIDELHDIIQWLETHWKIGNLDKVTKVTRMAQTLEFLKLQPLSKKAMCERISNKYDPISMGSLGSQLSYLKDPTRKDGGHVWHKDDLGRYIYQGCIYDANWDSDLRKTVKSDAKSVTHETPGSKIILRKKSA